jgi:hypothetical protein
MVSPGLLDEGKHEKYITKKYFSPAFLELPPKEWPET